MTFSQTSNLSPKILQGLYCFDEVQVRHIAKLGSNAPLKDSLIAQQDSLIHNLSIKVNTLILINNKQKTTISNNEIIILSLKEIAKNQVEKTAIIQKDNRDKSKKLKKNLFYSIGLNALLTFFIIFK